MHSNDGARWRAIGLGVWHLRQRRSDGGATIATIMPSAEGAVYRWYVGSRGGDAPSRCAAQRAVRRALREMGEV